MDVRDADETGSAGHRLLVPKEPAMVVAGLAALFFTLRNSSWTGSTDLHTLVEVVATLVAGLVGTLALLRFHAQREMTILLIGTGFFAAAMLDGYHAMVTSQWFDQLWPSPPPHLIPWSWNASRTFLSATMLLAWWIWHAEQRTGQPTRISEWTVYGLTGSLALGFFVFFAFAPLPRAYYPELPLGRPEELVSAVLFGAALAGYLRKGRWREDPFERGVVMSLVIATVGQALFMPLSFRLFDAMFDAAHLLKIAGYSCVLAGLLKSVRAILESEQDLRLELETVFDSVPEGLIVVNEQACIETANTAAHELFDFPDNGLIGESVHTLVPARIREQHHADVASFFHEFRRTALDRPSISAVQRGGGEIPVVVDLIPLDSRRGRRALAAVRDLRERLGAEAKLRTQAEELAQSNRELDDFAYIVSHDLKEPLRGIRNYAEFLLEDYGEALDEDGRAKLEALPRLTGRLERLLDSLLHYSRVGRTELATQPTDLLVLVEEVLDSIHVSLQETGVEVRIPQPLPTVVCDPIRVGEIFRNLLTNAMKYNDKES
ncbi:MAG: PAS domain-containing protein, partial [bacterium]|nr:PAS domain-containing protein [bacterium]